MRLGPRYDSVQERVGALLNLVPAPIGLSMFGMVQARALQVAQTTGMLEKLADGAASASEVSTALGLKEQGTALVLDVLAASRLLTLDRQGRYGLDRRAAKWLTPGSNTYLGDFLTDTSHYWEWWQGLEDLVREGRSVELHTKPENDPYWRSYITGQFQIARLSSDAVAKTVKLAPDAQSLLDVAGAHGEFSMALCRRHPRLHATVFDLPGSAAIGREIVASCGMSERVAHVDGDMFEVDLAGPHDGALAFNIVHHLSPEQTRELFSRIAASLTPGAPLCVLDLYDRPTGEPADSGSFLGLFFHLTSGADTYSVDQVSGWLSDTGFGPAEVKRLPQIPGLALLRAERS